MKAGVPPSSMNMTTGFISHSNWMSLVLRTCTKFQILVIYY